MRRRDPTQSLRCSAAKLSAPRSDERPPQTRRGRLTHGREASAETWFRTFTKRPPLACRPRAMLTLVTSFTANKLVDRIMKKVVSRDEASSRATVFVVCLAAALALAAIERLIIINSPAQTTGTTWADWFFSAQITTAMTLLFLALATSSFVSGAIGTLLVWVEVVDPLVAVFRRLPLPSLRSTSASKALKVFFGNDLSREFLRVDPRWAVVVPALASLILSSAPARSLMRRQTRVVVSGFIRLGGLFTELLFIHMAVGLSWSPLTAVLGVRILRVLCSTAMQSALASQLEDSLSCGLFLWAVASSSSQHTIASAAEQAHLFIAKSAPPRALAWLVFLYRAASWCAAAFLFHSVPDLHAFTPFSRHIGWGLATLGALDTLVVLGWLWDTPSTVSTELKSWFLVLRAPALLGIAAQILSHPVMGFAATLVEFFS